MQLELNHENKFYSVKLGNEMFQMPFLQLKLLEIPTVDKLPVRVKASSDRLLKRWFIMTFAGLQIFQLCIMLDTKASY